MLTKKYYDQALTSQCIEKLQHFYIEHGFWNFFISYKQFIKTETNQYELHLYIEKGTQHFLKNITIKGFPELLQTSFFQNYTKKYGLPLNPAWLADQRLYILDHFQKEGYWYVDAQPGGLHAPVESHTLTNATKNDHAKKQITDHVDVAWLITPGEQVTFDSILVRGSTRLPFSRILKEIPFKRGDLWNRKKLDFTRKKLKKLNIFKHIELYPKKLSTQQSKKPIILTLIDDDPVEIKLRTGYFLTSKNFLLKRESTYKIGSTLLVKNPLNIADSLSCTVDLSRFERNIDCKYQVPHFFIGSTIGICRAYHHKYVHPLQVGKSDSAYEAIQQGFLLGITKEFKQAGFLGINLGNEWMRTSKTRGNLKLACNMIDKTIPYLFIEPTILIDKLDSAVHTRKGSSTFCSLKLMVPEMNRSTTIKMMLDQSFFWPIYKNIIGCIRMRWGHIFRQKFEEIMPIERFFLGGPYSVRGYSKDTVPPLGLSCIIDPTTGKTKKEHTIQGGSSMINGNIELRFPLYKSIGGVIFQDIGVLSQSGFSGFTGRWYPTSGCGLRYKTPIGPLRFDMGWKWKKHFCDEPSFAWYLTLGQAF